MKHSMAGSIRNGTTSICLTYINSISTSFAILKTLATKGSLIDFAFVRSRKRQPV
jgi:hypothetical protein